MGGNNSAFWGALIVPIVFGLAWRISLHYWPATLLSFGVIAWLIWGCW